MGLRPLSGEVCLPFALPFASACPPLSLSAWTAQEPAEDLGTYVLRARWRCVVVGSEGHNLRLVHLVGSDGRCGIRRV
jgi:hypothetical protein